MTNPIRSLKLRPACTALALLGLMAALTAPALAAVVIHFQRESYEAFLGQLHKGEVHAVVLHPKGYKAHISLDDGRHMTVTYPAGEVAKLGDEARAKGASFTIATSTHKTATTHHKLRYIAGAVLIVVILVVLAVLLVGRRRALVEDEDPGSAHGHGGEPVPAPPAPAPPGAGAS